MNHCLFRNHPGVGNKDIIIISSLHISPDGAQTHIFMIIYTFLFSELHMIKDGG